MSFISIWVSRRFRVGRKRASNYRRRVEGAGSALKRSSRVARSSQLRTATISASFETLGGVRELHFTKESLLVGAEDELGSAICALQNPIRKLHGRPAT